MDQPEFSNSQYLTFKLDGETFGADIAHISKIIDSIKITPIPLAPEFMCGVTNIRGKAIPVIDLRLKLGLQKGSLTIDSSILVVHAVVNEEMLTLGALVDSVCEVIEIRNETIEAMPKVGSNLNSELIQGISRKDDGFIILLNIHKVFSFEELIRASQLQTE
jgi:purine-binding chemotaxis protein CheW